jgi:hypothetical protein
MNTCINRVIEISKPSKMTFGLYEEIWRLCGNQLFNGLYLTDFGIRKEKFIRQELDERVNLWLVVAITLSGVLLAGIQLFLSYRLAIQGIGEFAKDSELAIQSRRISLRSSVTGLIILCLSLIFFMVYVYWIYSIREIPVGRPQDLLESSESGPTQDKNGVPAASQERPSEQKDENKEGK